MSTFAAPWRVKTTLLLTAALCLCGSRASVAAGEGKTAPAKLTAAQIVERHIAARGGLQAWHAVQAISWTGKMDAGSGNSIARSATFMRGPMTAADKKKLAAASPA